ncbi:MAG: hypothetical protein LUE61_06980 [Clostridiales bacterium]|nr:hypothetical protein [Clostridiales bacterium]
MKRAYELTLNGTVYRLRLTARAQKKLIKAYGQPEGTFYAKARKLEEEG